MAGPWEQGVRNACLTAAVLMNDKAVQSPALDSSLQTPQFRSQPTVIGST